MNDSIDRAVVRVIEAMYRQVGDDLTVDDMARTAMYSKFHFSRMFRQVTGVSPGRFLSTVRFQEAKRLLASTSLSVAEISNRVGFSSLGTFSTRFKSSVGATPTEYRRGVRRWCAAAEAGADYGPPLTIRGEVTAGRAGTGHRPTFVGLFRDPVPHRSPVRFTVLDRPGPYRLEGVPEGTWYLLAHAAAGAPDSGEPVAAGLVGRHGPITIRHGATLEPADLLLRPMRTVDLPMLPAPFLTHPPAFTTGRR